MESVNVWSAQISSLPGVIPIPLDPSYLRSEPNNRLSVLSSDGKQIYTILNRVAKEILDLCDGTCDLPKILRLFQEKYPDQPRETLAHDLAQTLHSLTVNCLIVWKKEGRYMNDPFGSDYLTSVNPDELLILADASRFAEIEEAAAKSLSAKQSKNGNRRMVKLFGDWGGIRRVNSERAVGFGSGRSVVFRKAVEHTGKQRGAA